MKKNLDALFAAALLAIVALVGLLLPRDLAANTDVNVVVSTWFPSRVVASTGTSIRVDNWNRGVQGTGASTLLPGRVSLCCQNVSTFTATAYCGPSTNVSTQSTSGFIEPGWQLNKGDVGCEAIDRTLQYHCMAENAAGITGVEMACRQSGTRNP